MNESLALFYIIIIYGLVFAAFYPLIKNAAKSGPFKTIDDFTEMFVKSNYRLNIIIYYLLVFCFTSFLLTGFLFSVI